MKVLMLSPLFYPHIGGVEKHTKRLSEELMKKGHEISVVTRKYDEGLADFEIFNKIKIYRFPKMRAWRSWSWVFRHRNLIEEADIIHCHDYYTFISWYLPFRFLYFWKSVFITFHGYEKTLPLSKKTMFFRKIAGFLTRGNICIGDYISKWYGAKPDYILYGGVDVPQGRIQEGRGPSATFIGRLEKDTGVHIYVEAISLLKEKHQINLKLDVCGDGDLREDISEKSKRERLEIKLHGFVEEPTPFFKKNNFAFVSGYLAILEAMVNKRLVFSVYDDEIKKDYLYSLPKAEEKIIISSSAEELAQGLFYYLKNPEAKKEIVKSAYRFSRSQTWDKVVATYLKLWKK